MTKVMVFGWHIRDFFEKGRVMAAVWSRDPSRWDEGRAYAENEGYRVFVLDDTSDVLSVARAMVLSGSVEVCNECARTQRELAGSWHGGQWSAMYAFCSSGTILIGLDTEIRQAIREARGRERVSLQAFLDDVVPMCDELREAQDAEAAGY